MTPITIIPIAALAVVLLWFYSTYVSIVRKRNKVKESLSGIDVQLKKRHDLIPNILEIAKKFMEHEKGLLEAVTRLRTQAISLEQATDAKSVTERLQTEGLLQEQMGKLMVSVESYPELKSNQNMVQAQQSYNEVEEQLAAARRYYNSSVRVLDDSIDIFPVSMVASMVGVQKFPYFEATAEDKKEVNASDHL